MQPKKTLNDLKDEVKSTIKSQKLGLHEITNEVLDVLNNSTTASCAHDILGYALWSLESGISNTASEAIQDAKFEFNIFT